MTIKEISKRFGYSYNNTAALIRKAIPDKKTVSGVTSYFTNEEVNKIGDYIKNRKRYKFFGGNRIIFKNFSSLLRYIEDNNIIIVNEFSKTIDPYAKNPYENQDRYFLEKEGKYIQSIKRETYERLSDIPHKTILVGEERCEMHFGGKNEK